MQQIRPCLMGLDGKQWLFDEASWTLGDWFVIKNVTGQGRVSFLNGVLDEDPAALQALIWFLRRQNGEPNLRLEEVMFSPAALTVDEIEEPAESPDPPVAEADVVPLPTSANDVTTTSTSSPAGAASARVMLTP